MNDHRKSDADAPSAESAAPTEPWQDRYIARLLALGRWFRDWGDPFLFSLGWSFGMVFTTFAVAPLAGGERIPADLLALGIALFALSRAAAAGMYGRRHRCRCGETAAIPTPRVEAPVTSRPGP